MARQTFYLHRAQRDPLYKTRMLQAGPIELDASAARLYRRLGVELSEEAPKRAAKAPIPTVDEVLTAEVKEAPKKAAPKRKRTAKKKA